MRKTAWHYSRKSAMDRQRTIPKPIAMKPFKYAYIMKNNNDLVESLARNRVVEHLATNITHRPIPELGDLVQMVYEILLRKPPQQLHRVMKNKAINYYIVAIIRKLYFSKTSPYHRQIRRFGQYSYDPQK